MYGIALKPAVSRASTFASNTTRPLWSGNVAVRLALPAPTGLLISADLSAANGTSRTSTEPVVVYGLGATPVGISSKRS